MSQGEVIPLRWSDDAAVKARMDRFNAGLAQLASECGLEAFICAVAMDREPGSEDFKVGYAAFTWNLTEQPKDLFDEVTDGMADILNTAIEGDRKTCVEVKE
jgi:hypothetical protein